MSARSISKTGTGSIPHLTVEARQTRLSLSPQAVVLHKGGIEFRSMTSFAPWTEMTINLHSSKDGGRVHCNGVVIACTGNRHSGYHVSMIFTGMSRQAQARLTSMVQTQAP